MNDQPQFFDINQLPQEEGILFWGISMTKIGNSQSAEKCFEYLNWIDSKIKKTEGIGLITCYGDYLYFHSDEKATVLRDRYKDLMLSHKNGFMNLISKDKAWIKKAFSFSTFGQLMLDNSEIFTKSFTLIKELYQKDDLFKEAVDFDCLTAKNEVTKLGVMFILEEITVLHLASKGMLSFNNRLVAGTEQWVLQCYPGTPLKSEVYLFQTNPLKLSNPKNKYENCFYDLEGKKLYDYTKIELSSFNFF